MDRRYNILIKTWKYFHLACERIKHYQQKRRKLIVWDIIFIFYVFGRVIILWCMKWELSYCCLHCIYWYKCRHRSSAVLMFEEIFFRVLASTKLHYNDVIKGAITSQITSPTIVYLTVCSDEDQRKYQSSASLAFLRGIHRWLVNSPHKWPVTRKMFPFDDVIMDYRFLWHLYTIYGFCSTKGSTKGKSKVTFSKSNFKVKIISFPQLPDFRTYIWETKYKRPRYIESVHFSRTC